MSKNLKGRIKGRMLYQNGWLSQSSSRSPLDLREPESKAKRPKQYRRRRAVRGIYFE